VCILLGTFRANNLLILLNMLHVLALAITVYLLCVLIKVIFLSERGRAMLALPRFNNARFFNFLILRRNVIIVFFFVFFLFFLLLLLI